MEFRRVVSRRRTVRDFEPDPVPPEVLARVLETAQHAPSAGFSQGLDLVVLDEAGALEDFWQLVDPQGRKRSAHRAPPVIVVPVADRRRYLARYAEPDKRHLGLDSEQGWPIRYWELDAAMAVMLILLAAADEGLGAWFFGVWGGEGALARELGLPEGCRPIGAVALGYPAAVERGRGSAARRPRRQLSEVVHRGRW